MFKTVPVEEAIGMVLPHDITEIIKDKKKGVAFEKGHIIRREDITYLKNLGKDNIYVLSLTNETIHENEAATLLAQALAGKGVEYTEHPVEGKITITAGIDGLLRINKDSLFQFNLLGEVMCATLHDNTPVKKGEIVAATRLIPLVTSRKLVEKAAAVALIENPVVEVIGLPQKKVGLVITGSEVFYGRIEDRFEQVLREKLELLGSEVSIVSLAPDDKDSIGAEIIKCIEHGAECIITSGGMSVDPDDVTREGILKAGAKNVVYGTPVLPGAMFLVGEIGKVPVLGLPACGMYHKITVFDLILPRILTGQKIGRTELAELGHGGLCRNCPTCRYPVCDFGK
jgi:molybdenum cofactor synthesis domain-containing protein